MKGSDQLLSPMTPVSGLAYLPCEVLPHVYSSPFLTTPTCWGPLPMGRGWNDRWRLLGEGLLFWACWKVEQIPSYKVVNKLWLSCKFLQLRKSLADKGHCSDNRSYFRYHREGYFTWLHNNAKILSLWMFDYMAALWKFSLSFSLSLWGDCCLASEILTDINSCTIGTYIH